MSERMKHTNIQVSRDSLCEVTKGFHIPTTMEKVEKGEHIKMHVCRNCGGVIR